MTKHARVCADDDARLLARGAAKVILKELAGMLDRAAAEPATTEPDRIARSLQDPKDLARFRAKVVKGKAGDCWLWTGAIRCSGYGEFTVRGKAIAAHRYAYLLAYGAIAPGLGVLHACDVRACVNPRHLRTGTHAENAQDRIDRQRVARGERHHGAILKEADIRAIRASKDSHAVLAKRFGVNIGNIGRIRRGETWKHLLDECSDSKRK